MIFDQTLFYNKKSDQNIVVWSDHSIVLHENAVDHDLYFWVISLHLSIGCSHKRHADRYHIPRCTQDMG
jgi:hypothetical protein